MPAKAVKKLIFPAILLVAAIVAVIIFLVGSNGEIPTTISSNILINEVMSSNKGSVPDESGNYPDWIELHNVGSEEADAGGLGLTDDVTAGAKYVVPAGTKIPAGGYLVIYCSGEASTAFHAPFKISSNDAVLLLGNTGRTLDTVMLRAVQSGHTLARESGGTAWSEMKPSPGFANDAAGIAAYEATLHDGGDIGVYINEFMASNATTIQDKYGVFSDWIELYNSTDKDVDLSGYGISDSISQPMKYSFPEGTVIPAKGYLLIFCSGNTSEGGADEIHAPFSLRAYEEDVVFTGPRGTILDSYSFSKQETDVSMARVPDGTGDFARNTRPTPGYPNDDAGYQAYAASITREINDVYISEVMGMNGSVLAAADGEFYDWIELHNKGTEAVSLAGWGISTNPKNPAKWVFPDISIEAGEYIVLFASSLNLNESKTNLHTNFTISVDGETVFLFDASGIMLDKLPAGAFKNNLSYGRNDAGEMNCYLTATPGSANGQGQKGITTQPQFLTSPGIYDGEIKIELSAAQGETIHYTLDCTTPTAASPVYSGAISANSNTVVRAVSMRDGYITGYVNSGTYLFTGDGVNHVLPIATLVTDPDNLWDSETGIYAFGDKYDPDLPYGQMLETAQFYISKKNPDAWERSAAFSIFNDEGTLEFSQNVIIRIAGSFGRGRAQKGFNIIAREEEGNNRMEYPFFDNREFTEYKSLVLRAGAQDQNSGKFRDELATGLLEGMDVNVLVQAYEPYVLYLNGEYWGVYFLKEKRNRFFIAEHEGTGDNDNLDLIRSESTSGIYHGTNKEWNDLMAYVRANDLTQTEAYNYVDARVDLDSFMDYMICWIYSANSDYGNIQYYKTEGGKWKWILFDFCWSFGSSENGYQHPTMTYRRLNTRPCSDLFNALLKNTTWQDKFVRRFAEILNTVYTPERVNARINELYAIVEPEIARERELFNQSTFMGVKQSTTVLGTYEGFLRQVEKMRSFADNRPAFLKSHIQSELSLSDSYMREVFG